MNRQILLILAISIATAGLALAEPAEPLKHNPEWTDHNENDPGVTRVKKTNKRGKELKINITAPESGRLWTNRGLIHGYNGISVADSKHQVVVHADVRGRESETDSLIPIMEGLKTVLSGVTQKESGIF